MNILDKFLAISRSGFTKHIFVKFFFASSTALQGPVTAVKVKSWLICFLILFGKNETLPVEAAVWLPQLLIFLICLLGLTKINET